MRCLIWPSAARAGRAVDPCGVGFESLLCTVFLPYIGAEWCVEVFIAISVTEYRSVAHRCVRSRNGQIRNEIVHPRLDALDARVGDASARAHSN